MKKYKPFTDRDRSALNKLIGELKAIAFTRKYGKTNAPTNAAIAADQQQELTPEEQQAAEALERLTVK